MTERGSGWWGSSGPLIWGWVWTVEMGRRWWGGGGGGGAVEQHQAPSSTTVGGSRLRWWVGSEGEGGSFGAPAAEVEMVVSRCFLRLVFRVCVCVWVFRWADAAMKFKLVLFREREGGKRKE